MVAPTDARMVAPKGARLGAPTDARMVGPTDVPTGDVTFYIGDIVVIADPDGSLAIPFYGQARWLIGYTILWPG